jgi:glyoxylase I family protein
MALPIEKFSHICVRVSDVTRSLDWYRDTLGFDVLFDVELGGESLDTVTGEGSASGRMVGGLVGGTVIELLQIASEGEEPTARRSPSLGYTNISVSVADLDAARQQVADQQPGPIVDIGGVRMFFLADPDGTPVEVIEFPGDASTSAELWRGAPSS